MAPKPRRSIPALLALVVALSATPARADLFTVDWDVVPHDNTVIQHGDSPFYDCDGSQYENRLCYSLWDTGLALERVLFSFYDDRFYDGYGSGDTSGESVFAIAPVCKAGLSPCFDLFTPVTLRISGLSMSVETAPNLFVLSSRGGRIDLPSQDGQATINFVGLGSEWENLGSLELGFYLPAECDDAEPPEDVICSPETEKGLAVDDLTFEADAVPEPALLSLLAAGALGVGVRRRYRS